MKTVKLSKDLSVRQIAAIAKRLSRKQKDLLYDLIWDDLHYIAPEYMIPDEPLQDIMDSSISLEEFKKRHCIAK